MAAALYNVTIDRGDTWIEDFVVYDNGVPADITGGKLYVTIKIKKETDADGSAVLALTSPSGGIVFTNAALGQARMTVTAAQTAALTGGQTYDHDCQYKDAAGVVTTLSKGKLTIDYDVTQSIA